VSLVSPVLVGRQDLLEHIARRLAAASSGTGHLVLLSGEAGVGKTRLLRELVTRAESDGFTVLRAFTFARDLEVVGGTLLDLATDMRACTAPAAAEQGRVLLDLLGSRDPQPGDASRARRLTVDRAAEAVLDGARGDTPFLLALEDLHWADDLTLDVMERMVRRLADRCLLVVGTCRSDELYPRVPMRQWRSRMLTQRLAEEVKVPRLDPTETSTLAATITGRRLAADEATLLHRRSDGIPLHVEELLALGAGSPDQTTEHDGAPVPDTLAEAVELRASRLSETARDVAASGAVLGRVFDVDLVTPISGRTAEEVDAALAELCEQQLLVPRPDGRTYDFRHALIRDALYARLPPHRRRILHERVAEAAVLTDLGHAFASDHFERASRSEEAYRHARAAADEAAAVSAHREAATLYRRAHRTMSSTATDAERADLLVSLATELAATDDNAEAASGFSEAYDLRLRGGDRNGAAALVPALVAVRHLLGDDLTRRTDALVAALDLVEADEREASALRGRIEAALAAAYMLDRRLDEALRHGRAAHALATSAGDRATVLDNEATVGSVLVFAGQKDEGWTTLRRAVDSAAEDACEAQAARAYRMIGSCASVLVEYDVATDQLERGIAYSEQAERWNDRHYMSAHLAHVQWATGRWAEADESAQAALADGRGGLTTRITALHVLGYLALGRGRFDEAEAALLEALTLAQGMNELQRVSPALWGLAENALLAGLPDRAAEWADRGLAASAEVEDAAYLFPYLVTGTRARLSQNDLTSARRWVDTLTDLILRRSIPGTLPAVDHARGLVLLAAGQPGNARKALETASQGWSERKRFWEGTWALLDLAAAARRSRKGGQATEALATATRAATGAGSHVLARAAAAIAERTGSEGSGRGPLSSREYEVARLVAEGHTNKQIAEILFLSPKTVATHVEHILIKLDATRRAEIAAWAARQGPQEPQPA
jgi:predicted ATPase/DNA-binding CsgD family transcriptional regulator